jgi:hypothetical protein
MLGNPYTYSRMGIRFSNIFDKTGVRDRRARVKRLYLNAIFTVVS